MSLRSLFLFAIVLCLIAPSVHAGEYIFVLEKFTIERTRARHEDTDHVSFSIKVGDTVYGPFIKHMGNLNNGMYRVGLKFGPIPITDLNTPVTVNYAISNHGHGQTNEAAEKALKAGAAKLIESASNNNEGNNNDIFVRLITDAVNAVIGFALVDCDGPVAVDQFIFKEEEMRTWEPIKTEERTYSYESQAGCGKSPIYKVNWSIKAITS